MTKNIFEVKRGKVLVKVHERHRAKAGRCYSEFIVEGRRSGRRKLWTRSTLPDSKVNAAEVPQAIQKGEYSGQPILEEIEGFPVSKAQNLVWWSRGIGMVRLIPRSNDPNSLFVYRRHSLRK